jgi:hypothetical protein
VVWTSQTKGLNRPQNQASPQQIHRTWSRPLAQAPLQLLQQALISVLQDPAKSH